MNPPGKLILLNGASSAGKSSILKELQNTLEEPYLNAGIDKFIFMLPEAPCGTRCWVWRRMPANPVTA
jgi:chloramphenicol 3-O phosphotransferase